MSGRLDAVAPVRGLVVRGSRAVPADPGQIFAGLSRVPVSALAERLGPLRVLLRVAGIGDGDGPLYARLLASGFVVIDVDPLREVVVARILAPGRDPVLLRDRRDFVSQVAPGQARVAVGVGVEPGRVRVELRLRVVGLGRLVAAGRPLARRALTAFLDALAADIAAADRRAGSRRVA